MFIVYDLIFLIFALIYLPYVCLRGKWHKGFMMRMGFWPRSSKEACLKKKNIWVHAVSVGEVGVVLGLIEKMRQSFNGYGFVVSTVTPTGYALARSRLAREDVVIYAPLDFSPVIRAYVEVIRPQVYLSAETEIWPNLFYALHKRGVPVILVNGRISSRAYRRYHRVRGLLKIVLGYVQVFCMQSPSDADKVRALGAMPGRLRVVGNMKFDLHQDAREILNDFGWEERGLVWVAGSTHPGEEEILLDIFRDLRNEFMGLQLVLAPRHIERCEVVAEAIRRSGFRPRFFSRFLEEGGKATQGDVILVDTIGHLKEIYRFAHIVFIGKSLVVRGGQNIIEPASLGKPICIGPHTENFKNIMDIFREAGAVVQVTDAEDLRVQMRLLLRDRDKAVSLGRAAQNVVEKNRGATERTLKILNDLIFPPA